MRESKITLNFTFCVILSQAIRNSRIEKEEEYQVRDEDLTKQHWTESKMFSWRKVK